MPEILSMERLGSLTIPDHGLNTDDVKYFRIDSVIRGRGPSRLKYLDIEGRWVLNGRSIPYISAAFNHLERLNDAQLAFRDIKEEPLDAIGMIGWTPSSEPIKRPVVEKKPPPKFVKPVVPIVEEVPPSPREVMPHRSAGYGPAHQKRKLSIPDRSRSPQARAETPGLTVDYDKYAKYERKDSITSYGTRWGADQGYASEELSPRPSTEDPHAYWEQNRPPHRTQALSPQISTSRRRFDNEYSDETLGAYEDRHYTDELRVQTKRDPNSPVPYRTTGYGDYHVRRQYELSPRSTGSTDVSSGSEQASPVSGAKVERNADEVLVMAYHMAKGKRAGDTPRVHRNDWIRH